MKVVISSLVAGLIVAIIGGVYKFVTQPSMKEVFETTTITIPHYLTLMLEGRYEEAEPLVKEYKASSPQDGDAYLALADIYVNTGRISLAVQKVDALKKIDPDFEGLKEVEAEIQPFLDNPKRYAFMTTFNTAVDLINDGKFREAEEVLVGIDGAGLNASDKTEIEFHTALIYANTDRHNKAGEILNTILKKNPSYYRAKEILEEIAEKSAPP